MHIKKRVRLLLELVLEHLRDIIMFSKLLILLAVMHLLLILDGQLTILDQVVVI